ncbi:hypothetical protein UCRPC4_g01529 [Phaeomoniella chlamydospora]|uniref:Uncharacterized protein n=1 Tax=Phaeomoniella chlamydospora TaxID=158046 RepID=A0A0G2HCH8_PHACM|nr:hypothetical protein UCRPC4_g01529 [Phaeomoniella chlamydospora]
MDDIDPRYDREHYAFSKPTLETGINGQLALRPDRKGRKTYFGPSPPAIMFCCFENTPVACPELPPPYEEPYAMTEIRYQPLTFKLTVQSLKGRLQRRIRKTKERIHLAEQTKEVLKRIPPLSKHTSRNEKNAAQEPSLTSNQGVIPTCRAKTAAEAAENKLWRGKGRDPLSFNPWE